MHFRASVFAQTFRRREPGGRKRVPQRPNRSDSGSLPNDLSASNKGTKGGNGSESFRILKIRLNLHNIFNSAPISSLTWFQTNICESKMAPPRSLHKKSTMKRHLERKKKTTHCNATLLSPIQYDKSIFEWL
jgi:hypothetical protein